MTTQMDDVIDRIRKLLALSNSPNENEAATAAAHAAKLMERHNLEMAEIEAATGQATASPIEELEIDVSKSAVGWKSLLAMGLANLYGCHSYVSKVWVQGIGRVSKEMIFGRRDDARAMVYSYKYLCNEVERLADEAWDALNHKHLVTPRRWKNAFRVGCSDRIYSRLSALKKASAAPIPMAREPGVSQGPSASAAALAVIQRHELEVKSAWETKSKGWRRVSVGSSSDGAARAAGMKAGDGVHLGTGGRGQLGAEARRLGGVR